MTVKAQIELLGSANIIVGLHGAGLTNMMFMPPGFVLELRNSADGHNNCFFALASEFEHKYYYLKAQGDNVDGHLSDVSVDVGSLVEVVSVILEAQSRHNSSSAMKGF